MSATLLLVPVTDPIQTLTLPETDHQRLAWLQGHVGGYIEGFGADGWSAYCNEDGIALGLVVNVRATLIALDAGWTGGPLLGPVLFTGQPDWQGDDTSVPEAVVVTAKRIDASPWRPTKQDLR